MEIMLQSFSLPVISNNGFHYSLTRYQVAANPLHDVSQCIPHKNSLTWVMLLFIYNMK